MNFKKWLGLALSLLLATALIGCGDLGDVEDGVDEEEAVAIVNGEMVPKDDFDELLEMRMQMYEMEGPMGEGEEAAEMKEMLKQQTLDELIAQTVIMQNAEEAGITAADEEVDEEYQLLKDQYEDEEFQSALEAQNLTTESLKENIAYQLVIHQFVEEKVDEKLGEEVLEVSDDEMKAVYEQYSTQMDDLPDFEEMKPQLEEMVQQEKMQEVTAEIVNDLVEKSDIEILL